MSPPARYHGISFQEGLNVKNIPDLDSANQSNHGTLAYTLNLTVVVDKDAVEHHEYPSQKKDDLKAVTEDDKYKKEDDLPEG